MSEAVQAMKVLICVGSKSIWLVSKIEPGVLEYHEACCGVVPNLLGRRHGLPAQAFSIDGEIKSGCGRVNTCDMRCLSRWVKNKIKKKLYVGGWRVI